MILFHFSLNYCLELAHPKAENSLFSGYKREGYFDLQISKTTQRKHVLQYAIKESFIIKIDIHFMNVSRMPGILSRCQVAFNSKSISLAFSTFLPSCHVHFSRTESET